MHAPAEIGDHANQPAFHTAIAPKVGQLRTGSENGVLNRVFGQLFVTAIALAHDKKSFTVAAGHLLQRCDVASSHETHEFVGIT